MSQPIVLIIAHGMPPYIASLGGAVRVLKLAEFLTARGIETHILTGRGRSYGDFGYADTLKRLNIHYIDDPMLSLAGEGVVSPERLPAPFARAVARGKQVAKPIALDLLVPDTGVVASQRFKRAARDLIEKHNFSTIISSGPPHSDHLVALDLKRRKSSLNWIADYRDSWNGTALFRKRFWPAQKLNAFLERRVLHAADHVVTISMPMRNKAAALAGLAAENGKFHLIMNGFDQGLKAKPAHWENDRGTLKVGYFGFIDDRPDSYRNPDMLFEAALERDLPIIFELFGDARINPKWAQRLGKKLCIRGSLPHAQAVEAMGKLDVLMLLHTRYEGADEVVTGKVFEYILAARPILSIGPGNMAVNDLLKHDESFYAVRHDQVEGIAEVLVSLYERKLRDFLPQRSVVDINKYSRENQYEKYLSILK